eukprot:1510301-Pyramimonas_sp.AAC.1
MGCRTPDGGGGPPVPGSAARPGTSTGLSGGPLSTWIPSASAIASSTGEYCSPLGPHFPSSKSTNSGPKGVPAA